MMRLSVSLALAALAAFVPLSAGAQAGAAPAASTPVASKLDPAIEARLMALDPTNVSAEDVRDVLSKVPAPRIILLHGGVFPVHLAMNSFGAFLVGMGYPEDRIRYPYNQDWSHSPYSASERIAGIIAYHYEQDGMRPMMVGHSQGGMQVSKVMHDLAGTFGPDVKVWNPFTDTAEARTTIVDPATGKTRPVAGGAPMVSYASAVGAGGPSGVLPNQWGVIGRLRDVPDSVVAFDGYFIGIDWFAMSFSGTMDPYKSASGKVKVRNVVLPAGYLHVTVPVTGHLPEKPEMKAFIDAYRATTERPDEATMPGTYSDNVYYAADNWALIKEHWVREAQALVKSRRASVARS